MIDSVVLRAVKINGQALPSAAIADTGNDAPENKFAMSPDGYHGWNKPTTSLFLSITVLGATGDLARNKIFPALFALYYSGNLYTVLATPSVCPPTAVSRFPALEFWSSQYRNAKP